MAPNLLVLPEGLVVQPGKRIIHDACVMSGS